MKVKNISNKPITYIGMYYDFPETKATGNIMAFPLRYGQNLRVPPSYGEPKRLLPGETADVTLSNEQYGRLKSFLETRHLIADIHKASIRLVDVDLADGTIWDGGDQYRIDPNNPHKLIPTQDSN